MPSRAETARFLGEWAARATVLALLGWLLLRALFPEVAGEKSVITGAELPAGLERWTLGRAPASLHVRFDSLPRAEQREWLAAIAGAGSQVGWSASGSVPTAMMLSVRADPAGATEVAVAAPPQTALTLRDQLGPRDSVRVNDPVVRWHLGSGVPGAVEVGAPGGRAMTEAADSLTLRRLLVLGRAEWEGRFVVAALAERGWQVDARFAVGPGTDVRRGLDRSRGPAPSQPLVTSVPSAPGGVSRMAPLLRVPSPSTVSLASPGAAGASEAPLTIDTSRYAAVVALDSTAARQAAALRRYVGMGGGLLLWSEAAASPLRTLAAGVASPPPEWVESASGDSVGLADLPLGPITTLHPDAVPLEQRGGLIAVAARRIGVGRVLQVGYGDSWRLRMQGQDSSSGAYREWLAGLVSRVAFAPATPRMASQADAAPYASLVDRLGPPEPVPDLSGGATGRLPWWYFGLLLLLLLGEWSSRRFRGVR